MSGYKLRRILLTLGFAAVLGTPFARADVTYTYTGNQFNDLRNGATCPPTCNVTGSFVVATALDPNLPLTLIMPLSFSLSSAGITLTDGDPSGSSLSVGTDASGMISTWEWVELGPAASIEARILTENVPSIVADDVRFGDNSAPFVGFAGPTAGLLTNDPGGWVSTVPEPSTLGLLASALAALALLRRRSIR
jgi:hypothetical protein